MALRSTCTGAGRLGAHVSRPSRIRWRAGETATSELTISRSSGSVMSWALNRANHVGLPRADRWSVTGRTRQVTQSRTDGAVGATRAVQEVAAVRVVAEVA